MMGVPRPLAQDVADLIARRGGMTVVDGGQGQLVNGWTEELLRRAYRESKENVRHLLEHLATHPDQEFGTPDIANAIGVPDWNSVAGMMGPFSRRCKGRYKMQLPPWVQRTDSQDRDHLRMPADVAAVIRKEAGL